MINIFVGDRFCQTSHFCGVLKVQMHEGENRNVNTRKGVAQGHFLSLISFNFSSEYHTKRAPERFKDFKTGGKITHTVKYADDLVLLAEE